MIITKAIVSCDNCGKEADCVLENGRIRSIQGWHFGHMRAGVLVPPGAEPVRPQTLHACSESCKKAVVCNQQARTRDRFA